MDGVVSARGRGVLSADEIVRRAGRVRLVVTDCDGVLTDAGVYYSERGEELKRFNLRDGMAVELLRNAGIATAILTREVSGAVQARAAKLRLSMVWLGVRDKLAHLEVAARDAGVTFAEIAYIGDDVNDLEVIEAVGREGLTAAPADAVRKVKEAVVHVCEAAGGHGAFRELADWVLDLKQRSSRRLVVAKTERGATS
jgi:3-deoxy-D-manno-octulosonate 8-phosphate phosphatase (KDO 8-P phosphatase)